MFGRPALLVCVLGYLYSASGDRHSMHWDVRKGDPQKGFAYERNVGRRAVEQKLYAPQQTSLRYTHKIPLILHYVYLSGYEEFLKGTEGRDFMSKRFYDTCLKVLSHWEIKFWTQETAYDFLKTKYPEFLPVWESYDQEVKRADALRPFLLFHFGGMYLDLDNECYVPAERLFENHTVVLQGSGFEGLNNGMMASAPGAPFWRTLIKVLVERHSQGTDDVKRAPLWMTGPQVLRTAFQRHMNMSEGTYADGFRHHAYQADGGTIQVYSLGEFFMPCWGADLVCIQQYDRSLKTGVWDMSPLVGRHWFAGTWNKPYKLFPDKFKPPPPPPSRSLLSQAT